MIDLVYFMNKKQIFNLYSRRIKNIGANGQEKVQIDILAKSFGFFTRRVEPSKFVT